MRVLLAAAVAAGLVLCVGCGDVPQVSREDDEFLYSLGREENGGDVENGGEIGMENGGFDGDFDNAALAFMTLMTALAVSLAGILRHLSRRARPLNFPGSSHFQGGNRTRRRGNIPVWA